MGLIARIKAWLESRRYKPLDQWFFVTFDESAVTIRATPPAKEPWEQSFPWSSVTRVCFEDGGLYLSDCIYIFTSLRPESFVIPTEAAGGPEFVGALVGRQLFPWEVMEKAITATDGGLYCWPPIGQGGGAG